MKLRMSRADKERKRQIKKWKRICFEQGRTKTEIHEMAAHWGLSYEQGLELCANVEQRLSAPSSPAEGEEATEDEMDYEQQSRALQHALYAISLDVGSSNGQVTRGESTRRRRGAIQFSVSPHLEEEEEEAAVDSTVESIIASAASAASMTSTSSVHSSSRSYTITTTASSSIMDYRPMKKLTIL